MPESVCHLTFQPATYLRHLFGSPHYSSSPKPDDGTLCAVCAQISYEQMDTSEGQLYHSSWGALVESAEQGCPLCTFFVTTQPSNLFCPTWDSPEECGPTLDSLEEYGPIPGSLEEYGPIPGSLEEYSPTLDSPKEYGPTLDSLKEYGPIPDPPEDSGPLFLRTCTDYGSISLDMLGFPHLDSVRYGLCLSNDIDVLTMGLAEKIPLRMRFGDRASEKAIEKVQSWLNECENAHPNCRKIGTPPLPTRVLDISQENSCWIIRLLETRGATAAYIALSHCWGKEMNNANGQTSKCTSENINSLFQGLSIDTLPPLYRDAVIMTHKLGKRYLWIDSLCIIQDSKDDWSKECAQMADIYANSFLTISASSCENSQEGFIKATVLETHAKLTTIPGSLNQHIYVQPWNRPIAQTPLEQRAWVFQEKVLSSRVLNFTAFEMFLLCDQHEVGEDDYESGAYVGCHGKQLLYTAENRTDLCPYTQWIHLIENYSRLDLTYSTDKFPALSGIAHIIQQRTGDEYVAGFWKNVLVDGLLWMIAGRKEVRVSDKPAYIAPTWSWASVQDFAIRFGRPLEYLPLQLDVVDVQVDLLTPNPFGEIKSASLVVDAPLRECLEIDERRFHEYIGEWELRDRFGYFVLDLDSRDWRQKPKSLAFLPCVEDCVVFDQRGKYSIGLRHGLALEPIDRKRRVYKRVGLFRFHHTDLWTWWFRLQFPVVFDNGEETDHKEKTWHSLGFVDTRVTII